MLKFNTEGHSLNGGTWSVIGNLNQSGHHREELDKDNIKL